MRRAIVISLIVLCGLSLQPAQAGPGWGRVEAGRREFGRPEPPRFQRPPRPPPRPGPGAGERPPEAEGPKAGQTHADGPAGRSMAPPEAAQRARQINGGGRVLAVEPADNGYRVRILKDGEVRSLYVPSDQAPPR